MFVTTYLFRAEVSKASLIAFISNAPPEYYSFLVPPDGTYVYGCMLTDDIVEYFLNEFPVRTFYIVEKAEIDAVAKIPGCKFWGNRELLPT
jgi:hypothetical protein